MLIALTEAISACWPRIPFMKEYTAIQSHNEEILSFKQTGG